MMAKCVISYYTILVTISYCIYSQTLFYEDKGSISSYRIHYDLKTIFLKYLKAHPTEGSIQSSGGNNPVAVYLTAPLVTGRS